MYRSFYIVVTDCDGGAHRFDSNGFSNPFGLYRSIGPGCLCRLFGVDQMDRSILLGTRIG
jgi:hypothetical protein